MNDYVFIIPIALSLMVGVISPGPSFIFVAQTAMEKSRAHGIITSLGMGTGAMLFSLMAILGLFVVLQTVPVLYVVLKLLGGFYLLYIAFKMWQTAQQPIVASDVDKSQKSSEYNVKYTKRGYFKSYLMGLLTQLSNPKTAIVIGGIFMAFLPQDIPDYSVLLLSLMAFIIDAGWYMIVSIALTTKSAQRLYLRFRKYINWLASGLMGALGIKLVLNQ